MKIQLTPKHAIGEHEPVFIVAEVGSNWKTFDHCIDSIQMAKTVGADAVKFQAFTGASLYGTAGLCGAPIPGTAITSCRELPLDWLPKLKGHADAVGIEFMCSAFSPGLIDAVNPYVNVHKVASAEMTHVRMLEVLKAYGKPVILSTGAHGDHDIQSALDILGNVPTALLYCIAAYPARSVRLEHIDLLRSRFNRLVGFSDHTTDIFTAPAEAIFQHKAVILEKHFNAIDGLEGSDSAHSLNPSEFKLMVTRCRNNLAIESRQSHEENEMVTKHNRRLIAIRDINAGDIFKEGHNFGIYRSLAHETKALSPFTINQVNGRAARVSVKAGEGIAPIHLT